MSETEGVADFFGVSSVCFCLAIILACSPCRGQYFSSRRKVLKSRLKGRWLLRPPPLKNPHPYNRTRCRYRGLYVIAVA